MKVKDIKALMEDCDDDTELYYPHYYKGYGLKPVGRIDKGNVSGEEVLVCDWDTALFDDSNFFVDKTMKRSKAKFKDGQKVVYEFNNKKYWTATVKDVIYLPGMDGYEYWLYPSLGHAVDESALVSFEDWEKLDTGRQQR